LAAGVKRIEELFAKAVERRLLSEADARQKMAGVKRTTTWEGFDNLDLVVEAAIEDLEKKREIFRILDQKTRPETILATNTSSLLVRQLAEGLQHPERVAGLHFFNPVHKMELVEVVRAPATTGKNVAALRQWAGRLGKTPVIVGDSPGFVVNRILLPYLSEAGLLLTEGVSVEAIDRAMLRFGMRMGPLETLDQVGLDVAAHIARAVAPFFGERLPPQPALERLCEWGCLGRKNGRGFYRYDGKRKTVNTEALAKLGHQPTTANGRVPHEAIRERLVLLSVNEAAACLREGLAERADVIDLAMVLGTGWAPHRGGPLRYADDRGAADVVRALEGMARQYGPRFAPDAELRRRAETKDLFYSTLPTLEGP
jgi:3-hydroxyacyl-CoA dehydrogenase/enoyl-CoA hydratase/3-hydroxybutyryl-CoA epimerase